MPVPQAGPDLSFDAEVPREWWRYTVSLLGALLLGVGVGSALLDGRLAGDEVQTAGLVVLTLSLTAVGSRVAVVVADRDGMLRIVLWISGAIIAFAALGAWLQAVFRTVESGFDAALVFLSVLAAGALLGAVVGYYDVRVRGLSARAGREQARREFLGEQQEALSTLNGVLRHQILNDLAAISGQAELLADDRVDREAALGAILDHCDHMDATVSRIETLITVLASTTDTHPASVGTAVDRAREKLAESHPGAAVTVESRDGEDADPSVLADDLLSLAVYEVLENAVVHGESPRVAVERAGGAVTIGVVDEGPGLSVDPADAVEPNTRGPDSDGDGLGLFIADLIVTRYDGRIDVADGRPTRVDIVVPAADAPSRSPGVGPAGPGA